MPETQVTKLLDFSSYLSYHLPHQDLFPNLVPSSQIVEHYNNRSLLTETARQIYTTHIV